MPSVEHPVNENAAEKALKAAGKATSTNPTRATSIPYRWGWRPRAEGPDCGRPFTAVVAFAKNLTLVSLAGILVPSELVAEMLRPHGDWPKGSKRYGLGFHPDATGDGVWLGGSDAGVSFASRHQPSSSITCTVISNCSEGAWPITSLLNDRLGT